MALFGTCNPGQPWSQMSFSRRPGRFIVASEDMDRGAWTRLSPPETLTARARGGALNDVDAAAIRRDLTTARDRLYPAAGFDDTSSTDRGDRN